MYCPYCMNEIKEGSFCPHCNKEIVAEYAPDMSKAAPIVTPVPTVGTVATSAYVPDNANPSNPVTNQSATVSQKPKKKKSCFVISLIILLMASLLGVLLTGVIILLIVLGVVGFSWFDMSELDFSENNSAIVEEYDNGGYPGFDDDLESENETIIMISCINMNYLDAESYLEDLGIEVEIVREYNDEVEKDLVIGQSVGEGAKLSAGDTVTLYVSDGPDENPDGYNQKVVVSASKGSHTATLKLYNWVGGDWVEAFSCKATVGSAGISSNYGENSTATPKGTFPLGVVLFEDYIKTGMDVYYVTEDTCIVDDSSSVYYNTIRNSDTLPSGTHYEDVGDIITGGDCNALIFIEHNGDGFTSADVVSGKGSAITICGVNGTLGKTGGCVDITASDMEKLLALLDVNENPHIEIKTN